MRFYLGLVVSLFAAISASAQQDTVFYAVRGNRVEKRAQSKTYVVLVHTPGDTTKGVARTYLTLGDRLIHENPFTGYWNPLHNGLERAWDSTGRLTLERNAVNGKLDGEFKTYYSNGQLRRYEVWKMGERQKGTCYDSSGREIPFFAHYIPPLTKRTVKLEKFIYSRVDYNQRMLKQGITGTILVSFIVNRKGAITYVNIERGLDPELDKQVERAVWEIPNGTPGLVEGKPFPVRVTMPITFSEETVKRKRRMVAPMVVINPTALYLPAIYNFGLIGYIAVSELDKYVKSKRYQMPGNPIYFEEPIAAPLPLD